MPKAMVASAFLAAALILQSNGVWAAGGNPQQLRDTFVSAYGSSFRPDQLAFYVNGIFQSIDTDRDGIERTEIDRIAQKMKAEIRARIVGQYLQYDLNGDFEITSEEVIFKPLHQPLF